MDQALPQQLSASHDTDYQSLASATYMDLDNFPATQYYAHQSFPCNTSNVEGMCLEMSQQLYDSTGAFDVVKALSTANSLEHSRPSTQNQQTYLDHTTCSSLGPCDLIPTQRCSSTSTAFMSPTPISDDEPAHDLSVDLTACSSDNAVASRKDRRRAQNRAAQRGFRARKEEAIKEGTVKVKELQDNLAYLQSASAGHVATVASLRAQLLRLQGENTVLKHWRLSVISLATR